MTIFLEGRSGQAPGRPGGMGMVRMGTGTAWGLLGNGADGGSASQSLGGSSSWGLGWPAASDGGTMGGFRGGSRLWDSFVSPRERGGLALAPAKGNRKAGFRNRAYSPGTHEVFPVQRLLPVGREVRRAS